MMGKGTVSGGDYDCVQSRRFPEGVQLNDHEI